MNKNKKTKSFIHDLVDQITDTYHGDSGINFIDATNLPVRDKIVEILEMFMEMLFPGYTGKRKVTKDNVEYILIDLLYHIYTELVEQVERAIRHSRRLQERAEDDCGETAEKVTISFLSEIPKVRELLKGDIAAAYAGDPAASSYEEIVISYPCIVAIAVHRIAHELYKREVPLIPRIMNEYAHSKTGIDIHPGANIGENFFIDHGTGVVIGETTRIGKNVKIYQGTTLGALSFPQDERGNIIKGQKRHPTIEDNVTIYAEATILGNITIGEGAVIGGNAWIKDSVPANYMVTTTQEGLKFREKKKK